MAPLGTQVLLVGWFDVDGDIGRVADLEEQFQKALGELHEANPLMTNHDRGKVLARLDYVGDEQLLYRTSEAYLYDSFTDPAYRGSGIAPALGVHVLGEFRRAGVTRAMMAVAPENAANRRARAKTGFRAFGRIDQLRLGRWSWHWHRTVERRSRT